MILTNIFQRIQQHCCTTAAGMLQVFIVVAPKSQQTLILSCASLYLRYKKIVLWRREFIYMFCIKQRKLYLMISLFAFSQDFNATTKCAQRCAQQDRIFHLKVATASALMSGDVMAITSRYNLYIILTQTIMQV